MPNRRYTAEFKQQVIETMREDGLSYKETARRFEICNDKLVAAWERIYLTECPDGFSVERRGAGTKVARQSYPRQKKKICWPRYSG